MKYWFPKPNAFYGSSLHEFFHMLTACLIFLTVLLTTLFMGVHFRLVLRCQVATLLSTLILFLYSFELYLLCVAFIVYYNPYDWFSILRYMGSVWLDHSVSLPGILLTDFIGSSISIAVSNYLYIINILYNNNLSYGYFLGFFYVDYTLLCFVIYYVICFGFRYFFRCTVKPFCKGNILVNCEIAGKGLINFSQRSHIPSFKLLRPKFYFVYSLISIWELYIKVYFEIILITSVLLLDFVWVDFICEPEESSESNKHMRTCCKNKKFYIRHFYLISLVVRASNQISNVLISLSKGYYGYFYYFNNLSYECDFGHLCNQRKRFKSRFNISMVNSFIIDTLFGKRYIIENLVFRCFTVNYILLIIRFCRIKLIPKVY